MVIIVHKLRNGWSNRRDRVRMAIKCLKGHSVMFNARIYVTNELEEPVKITPINPTAHLYVKSCLFAHNPEEPQVITRVIFDDYKDTYK